MLSNAIVPENQLPGTPPSVWGIDTWDASIQGFTTDSSVNHGQTISFKINDSTLTPYRIDIYRLGYYQDNGARLVTTIDSSQTLRLVQPSPLSDPATGLIDAGNWAVSASWAVPATATSGLYFARFTRDVTGEASGAYFIVRADDSTSDLLFQTSDSTWQAYNAWGGNSLYTGTPGTNPNRAYKVSYNRPLTLDGNGSGDANSPLHAEYPMIRWLEANGYDVSYSTDVDSDRNGSLILNHKAFLSVGHDEYWSGPQRANVTAARDAGVNLAFFSGNEVYWKTRWETSIDGSGTPYRTLVCYKESKNHAKIDPSPLWTGTWRDNRFSPPADGGRPENALTGTIYMNDRANVDLGIPMTVSAADAGLRFWRNTAVANLAPGQTTTLGQYTVGYEVDEDLDNGSRPAGLMTMSSTTFTTQTHVVVPWGTEVAPGTGNHKITLYRAPSGALVFGAGTIHWSWGLDGTHNTTFTTPDQSMQQATVNLFADMRLQSATLQPGLVAGSPSTDTTAPTSTIAFPTAGANLSASTITVTGTATDVGGTVGGVEVSVDGGVTWHPATGRSNWSYTWTPDTPGPVTVKTRAVDDSGNLEAPAAGVTVNVVALTNATIWPSTTVPAVASANDPTAVEVGVKFRLDVAGFITGVRFYKGPGNTGTHLGHLWTASGTLLASATFAAETATGWQQVDFAQPVSIQANTTYVASYYDPNGNYSYTSGYFVRGFDRGVLHAPSNAAAAGNGVFLAGSSGFPTNSFNSFNYWVDIVFNTTVVPAVTATTPAAAATAVSTKSAVTATFNRAMDATTVNNSTFHLRPAGAASDVPATVTYSGFIATLQPNAKLAMNTVYQATVSGSMAATDGTPLGSDTSWSFTTEAKATLTNTTTADFFAGTPDAGATVAQTDDGEVILKPTAGSEFFGTVLPADWTSAPNSAGGAASVSGGRLTADGAIANTTTLYTTGRSLEFVATFSGDSFQHVGFADFSSNVWAMFSTGSGGALYARTAGPGGSSDTPLAPGLLGAAHRFRVDWTGTSVTYFVDGVQVASHNLAVTNPMRPTASDYNAGGGVATVDWMRMTPYAGSGTFLSRVLDAGGPANWLDATWSAGLPSGTSLAMSVRLGDTPIPDGTWTDFIALASSGAAIGRNSRYVQYRASLATTDPAQTPALQAVTLGYKSTPVANNDSYKARKNVTLTVAAPGLLTNDTDPEGGTLTAVLVAGPTHGTLIVTANGSFTYTPATDYTGNDSFTYQASNGQALSNVATVSLTVTAPTATNDAYEARKNVTLTVAAPGVLANDSDPDGLPLTAVLVASPLHGTLTLNANGSLSYLAAIDYTGSDSFAYQASGGGALSNVATVSLTVTAPVAANDAYKARKNVTLTVAASGVLANDTDPDGLPLTAVLVASPLHGTLTLNANGSFSYLPATDYTGSDSFTYQASAGGALSNVATVSLTITAPVAGNDSYSTVEEKALSLVAPGVLGNDTDPDGYALTAVLVSGPSHGTLTLNANGSFTYTPATAYVGTDSFTYKDSGGGTFSNVATVTITVTAPTLSINDVRAQSTIANTFSFTVTLSSSISQAVTVSYATADGTAMAPLDYLGTSGTVTFQPGQTSQTISVQVLAHPLPGPDKTFFVNLSAPSNATITRAKGTGTIVSGAFLHLDGEAVAPAADVQPLTTEVLGPIVSAAAASWAAAGLGGPALNSIDVRIVDLADNILGAETPGVIWIDINAAGHGWFVDANPADPVPADRVDLLTVVAHEMGHALGFEHSEGGVMQESLAIGVRDVPNPMPVFAGLVADPVAQPVSAPAQRPGEVTALALPSPFDASLLKSWVDAWLRDNPGAAVTTDGALSPVATGSAVSLGDGVAAAEATTAFGTSMHFADPLTDRAVVDQFFANLAAADDLGSGLRSRLSLS